MTKMIPLDAHKHPHKIQCRQRNACLHQLPNPSEWDRASITAQNTGSRKPTAKTSQPTDMPHAPRINTFEMANYTTVGKPDQGKTLVPKTTNKIKQEKTVVGLSGRKVV